MSSPRRGPEPPGHQPKGAADAAFNIWLQRGLHAMFDDVANEPIPDELRDLIERDRNK